MTEMHLAALTLETWRASGARTTERRDYLLLSYAESYYGDMRKWSAEISAFVDSARQILRRSTRIDELTY